MSALVVSLDFEMRWGVLDRVQDKKTAYSDNLLSVNGNVHWLLQLFEERGISATWATVGALGCRDWDEFERFKPRLMPKYLNNKMDYDNKFNSVVDPLGQMYFGHELIKKILKTEGQELGMHTFGHIYGTEPDVTFDEFTSDIKANINIFRELYGVVPTALVYPRNQVIHEDALLKSRLIETFRGNENPSWYSAESQRKKMLVNRARALIDSLNPYVSYSNSMDTAQVHNLRSSAMLRIHMNSILRKIHLCKLRSNISSLASNEYFHLWFHPHNIGNSVSRKKDLVVFLDFIGDLVAKGKLSSENMHTMHLLLKKRRNL